MPAEFSVIGVRVGKTPKIVSEVQTPASVELVVKDMADKTDATAYVLSVSDPGQFFGLDADEDLEASVRAKAKAVRDQPNSVVKALVQREGKKYALVHTHVM